MASMWTSTKSDKGPPQLRCGSRAIRLAAPKCAGSKPLAQETRLPVSSMRLLFPFKTSSARCRCRPTRTMHLLPSWPGAALSPAGVSLSFAATAAMIRCSPSRASARGHGSSSLVMLHLYPVAFVRRRGAGCPLVRRRQE